MAFADYLQQLPSIAHLAALELLDSAGNLAATIPNQAGKAGSLAVYAALAAQYGQIDVAAAEQGLVWFAEHTDDARAHPGNHPNIDRLLQVIASGQGYRVRLIAA